MKEFISILPLLAEAALAVTQHLWYKPSLRSHLLRIFIIVSVSN